MAMQSRHAPHPKDTTGEEGPPKVDGTPPKTTSTQNRTFGIAAKHDRFLKDLLQKSTLELYNGLRMEEGCHNNLIARHDSHSAVKELHEPGERP